MKIKGSSTFIRRRRSGVVLILTLLVLIVLATITYQLTVRLMDRRRADDYLIYYQGARYACDSGLKYALATTQIIDPKYADRTEAPDFSDLFGMTDEQIDEILRLWADQLNDPNSLEEAGAETTEPNGGSDDLLSLLGRLFGDEAAPAIPEMFTGGALVEPSQLSIPGPYGPPWPLVSEPIEFEVGSAKVTITIEDENAKLPLIWMTSTDEQLKPVTQEVLRVFCAWYGLDDESVAEFRQKLEDAAQIKSFKFDLGPIVVPAGQGQTASAASTATPATSRAARMAAQQTAAPAARQPYRTYADYSKIMASTLVDTDWLTIPVIEGRSRLEYPLKYLAVWGSTTVNINTAPRHVLEAAFAYGGDADKLAEAVIAQRQEKPFENIDDLRKRNLTFSSQIQKCEKYITFKSDFFTIRIKATNGPATCMATAAVIKKGGNVTRLAAVFE